MGKVIPFIKDINKYYTVIKSTTVCYTKSKKHHCIWKDEKWCCRFCGKFIEMNDVKEMSSSECEIPQDPKIKTKIES